MLNRIDAALVPGAASPVLEFGAYRLTPRRRELLHNGSSIRIGARAFDLLTALASRPGEVISHAELMRCGWPNLVVCDCNLKVQIAGLQKILGQTPSGGRHVASVASRGYVFVAEVRVLLPATTPLEEPREPLPATSTFPAQQTVLPAQRACVGGWQ